MPFRHGHDNSAQADRPPSLSTEPGCVRRTLVFRSVPKNTSTNENSLDASALASGCLELDLDTARDGLEIIPRCCLELSSDRPAGQRFLVRGVAVNRCDSVDHQPPRKALHIGNKIFFALGLWQPSRGLVAKRFAFLEAQLHRASISAKFAAAWSSASASTNASITVSSSALASSYSSPPILTASSSPYFSAGVRTPPPAAAPPRSSTPPLANRSSPSVPR